jgi:pre-mRNA cleavage complex 2 protein Pcf11
MPNLRDAMQSILDDLQSDVQDELEKVSLERLAAIDSDLLVKIKQTAEDSFRNGNAGASDESKTEQEVPEGDLLSFLVETRTPEAIEHGKAWGKLNVKYMKDTNDIIASLQHLLRDGSSAEKRYIQQEAVDTTAALAAAAVTAGLLTTGLQQIKDDEKKKKSGVSSISGSGSGGRSRSSSGFVKVDKSLFTNDGLKKKNDAVIGVLYELGLPFVSSADGRRFATQLELSNHLDALFKKGYVLVPYNVFALALVQSVVLF